MYAARVFGFLVSFVSSEIRDRCCQRVIGGIVVLFSLQDGAMTGRIQRECFRSRCVSASCAFLPTDSRVRTLFSRQSR